MFAKICGLGAAVPSNRVANRNLPKSLDTSDEWIKTRTGIKSRYLTDGSQTTSRLAIEAGRAAIKSHDQSLIPFDAVIVATTTPDRSCPATAPKVAHALGLGEVSAFDVNAVCSGFVYGLQLADALIKSKKSKKLLLIGADTFSSILDPNDRATFPLFGDAAAAMVLESSEKDNNIIDLVTMSNGEFEDLITVKGGGAESRLLKAAKYDPSDNFFKMNGKEVFSLAVSCMSDSVKEVLSRNQLELSSVDLLVPHQANMRIINILANLFDLDREKVLTSLEEYGNTSAASIPLTLVKGCMNNRIKANDNIVITAFGGGLTWGAGLMRWPSVNFRPEILYV